MCFITCQEACVSCFYNSYNSEVRILGSSLIPFLLGHNISVISPKKRERNKVNHIISGFHELSKSMNEPIVFNRKQNELSPWVVARRSLRMLIAMLVLRSFVSHLILPCLLLPLIQSFVKGQPSQLPLQ